MSKKPPAPVNPTVPDSSESVSPELAAYLANNPPSSKGQLKDEIMARRSDLQAMADLGYSLRQMVAYLGTQNIKITFQYLARFFDAWKLGRDEPIVPQTERAKSAKPANAAKKSAASKSRSSKNGVKR